MGYLQVVRLSSSYLTRALLLLCLVLTGWVTLAFLQTRGTRPRMGSIRVCIAKGSQL